MTSLTAPLDGASRGGPTMPRLPAARGPLTEALFDRLRGPLSDVPRVSLGDDPLGNDDLQLALYCCYELHYRSFEGVDDDWEWHPPLLAWRSELERAFEDALRSEIGRPDPDVAAGLRAIIDAPGPSLSGHMEQQGTLAQLREFLVHRSAYQLKEADPHTWAIPRLSGGPKAAMVGLQAEEYGDGVEPEMHSTLFAATLRELGLDASYGHYLELIPGVTLATTNVITLFGLHRRLRGALVGHLALFEMTSVRPMGRYSRTLERLGFSPAARRFYDVHVAVDQIHEVVAAVDLAGALAEQDPAIASDIVFGARAASLVEERFATSLLAAWSDGRTSLRGELPVP